MRRREFIAGQSCIAPGRLRDRPRQMLDTPRAEAVHSVSAVAGHLGLPRQRAS
jgi:hypothetical protein